MATFRRSVFPRALRQLALVVILATTLSFALLSAALPAGAVVTEVGGAKVGLQPRSTGISNAWESPETFANENGNVVLHGTSDYAIYWDPNKQMHHEWVTKIDTFLKSMGEANLATPFGVLGQYRDRGNAVKQSSAVFKGSYSDTSKFPAVAGCKDPNPFEKGAGPCLTDAQLREQLTSFITSHGLPTGMGTVYFVITPPGVTACLDAAATQCSDYSLSAKEETEEHRESVSYKNSFCSYHGDINPDNAQQGDAKTVLYAAIPWTAGTVGGIIGYKPKARLYEEAFDCQDGGEYPTSERIEEQEVAKSLSKEEKEKIEKLPPKEREEAEEAHRLEGPHQEEPNQEGKAESSDYSAGLSDLLINQIAEEEINTVTDPLLQSWHDATGKEVTDMCRNWFAATAGVGSSLGEISGSVKADLHTKAGTLSNTTVGSGRYYLNNVFSLASAENGLVPCAGGVALVARFTAPNPVNAGEVIAVDGMESTVGLLKGKAFGPSGPPTTTYSTFSWNFGDGTPEITGFAPGAPQCELPWLSPCAASALHSYQYGGTYNVSLKIIDVGGNTTTVTHQITVVGPPPPSTSPGSGSGPGTATSTTSGVGTSSTGSTSKETGKAALPAPVAVQSVLSTSLAKTTRKGLTLRYSVNQQVAGRFEVLLAASIAHRIGLHPPLATGLPAGTPPQVVIGKAILITTKGGSGTIKVQFGKVTAAHLRHLGKVSLTLRLNVRSASGGITTVLSKFTLR